MDDATLNAITSIIVEFLTQSPFIAVLYLMWKREAVRADKLETRLNGLWDKDRETKDEFVKLFTRKFEQQKSP